MKTYKKTLLFLLCSLGLSLGAHATTIATPVEFDFGTGAGQEDINAAGSDWTTTTQSGVGFNTLADSLQMVHTGSAGSFGNLLATVDTDLSAASQSSFSMATTLVISNIGASNQGFNRYGFTFFGDGGTGLGAFISPIEGNIRFVTGFDDNFNLIANQGLAGGDSFTEGATYTLSLSGSFNEGVFSATFSVEEVGGTVSQTLSHDFTATELQNAAGSEFGLGGRIRGGTDVRFDNLSIIPEPSAALLVGLGFLALLRRRR